MGAEILRGTLTAIWGAAWPRERPGFAATAPVAYADGVGVTPEQLARTLIRRRAEERVRADERAEVLWVRVREATAQLLAEGAISRAWLIGSLAWGAHGRGSDVDLVVEGLDPQAAPLVWDRLSGELGARVDLLRIESLERDFADRVRAEGVPLDVG